MIPAAEGTRPNVLIIQTDEHNFRTLGCYRALLPPDQAFIWGEGVKVDTPHIDSIAARGAICTRYYATSPVCTPSRAALMTG
ncbi:MAG: sulfatase-like hydrolase/transferase, partial [Verrucomicrobiae bacterium]|nr:sulfatase-like hydrolase/transferase [Verrucomicrobiae bacterium]